MSRPVLYWLCIMSVLLTPTDSQWNMGPTVKWTGLRKLQTDNRQLSPFTEYNHPRFNTKSQVMPSRTLTFEEKNLVAWHSKIHTHTRTASTFDAEFLVKRYGGFVKSSHNKENFEFKSWNFRCVKILSWGWSVTSKSLNGCSSFLVTSEVEFALVLLNENCKIFLIDR